MKQFTVLVGRKCDEHFVKETAHVYLHAYKITVKKGPTGNALIPSGLSDYCLLTSQVHSLLLQFANLVTSGGKNKLITRLSKVTILTFAFVELVESVECRGSHCGLRIYIFPLPDILSSGVCWDLYFDNE